MTYVVGLTGGIGSGKSAVARLFQELGVEVVDTDAIAHELTGPGGNAIEAIRKAFGNEVIGQHGALDRAKMRAIAFSDARERKRLETILHPLIRAEADRIVRMSTGPYVILVVPLLVEGGIERARYQCVLVVDCPQALQVERVLRRSELEQAEARRIIASQASREARLAQADDVIDNSGALEALAPQVARLHRKYLSRAGTYRAPRG
ncbi:MAG: dephospho-CoA kinase [Betaproteobacteria bacterium RIFCSPLOWO2_02_FULL_64_12]|nr:MAG: dephospho-CoA kinase [Betaproteobacteria bacterium RIFCSPLOWO2_02_FULL_64_12]